MSTDERPFTLLRAGALVDRTGRPALVLHGGGGPASVAGLVAHLASSRRVLAPTHPGWAGTPRPASLTAVADLAEAYLDLLEAEGAAGTVVVGSSIGGWIAADLAVRDAERTRRDPARPRAVGALVLVDAVGIEVPGEPVLDVRTTPMPDQVAAMWHDPTGRPVPGEDSTPEEAEIGRATVEAITVYACEPHYMHDPALPAALAGLDVPALVLWGASDRVCTPAYGRAYAALIPGASFALVDDAGHLPHVERPEQALAVLDAFVATLG